MSGLGNLTAFGEDHNQNTTPLIPADADRQYQMKRGRKADIDAKVKTLEGRIEQLNSGIASGNTGIKIANFVERIFKSIDLHFTKISQNSLDRNITQLKDFLPPRNEEEQLKEDRQADFLKTNVQTAGAKLELKDNRENIKDVQQGSIVIVETAKGKYSYAKVKSFVRPASGTIYAIQVELSNGKSVTYPLKQNKVTTLNKEQMDKYNGIDPSSPLTFTKTASIATQRDCASAAQSFLEIGITNLNGSCSFISADPAAPIAMADVTINGKLDEGVYSIEYAPMVQDQMGADAKNSKIIAVYGVASQYNGAEAPNTTPVPIGGAEKAYSKDKTQGPGAQRMYSTDQVELINHAVYKGMNAIANVLEEDTKATLLGGYLIPANTDMAQKVIDQFKKNGHKMASTCIGNNLRGAKDHEAPGDRPNQVYMVLAAAPALGNSYLDGGQNPTGVEVTITEDQKQELSFQTTLWAYRSLFKQGIALAKAQKELPEGQQKQVIIKPAALGLGAFENSPVAVAKAYYQAANEYAAALKESNIQVCLQIRPNTAIKKQYFVVNNSTVPENLGTDSAEQMAKSLGYGPAQYNSEAKSYVEEKSTTSVDDQGGGGSK